MNHPRSQISAVQSTSSTRAAIEVSKECDINRERNSPKLRGLIQSVQFLYFSLDHLIYILRPGSEHLTPGSPSAAWSSRTLVSTGRMCWLTKRTCFLDLISCSKIPAMVNYKAHKDKKFGRKSITESHIYKD